MTREHITTRQAAVRLGVTPRRVRQLIAGKRMGGVTYRHDWRGWSISVLPGEAPVVSCVPLGRRPIRP